MQVMCLTLFGKFKISSLIKDRNDGNTQQICNPKGYTNPEMINKHSNVLLTKRLCQDLFLLYLLFEKVLKD